MIFPAPKLLVIKRPFTAYSEEHTESDSIWIQGYEPMQLSSLPESIDIACNEEITFEAGVSGGIPPYTYSWTWGTETSDQQSFTLSTNVGGVLKCAVSDQCRSVEKQCQISVEGNSLDLGPDQQVCLNKQITLDAQTESETILWSTGATTSTIEITVTEDAMYWCEIESCGELVRDTIYISVKLPFADAGEDQQICPQESVILTANEGESYLWNTGETTQSITVQPEEDTEYWVRVWDQCENYAGDSVWVRIAEAYAYAGEDCSVCDGESLTFSAEGGNSIEWWHKGSRISTQRDIQVKPSENMQLILKTFGQCEARDTLNILWHPKPEISWEPESLSGCSPVEVCLYNKVDPQVNWTWYINGEQRSTTEELSLNLSDPGSYSVKAGWTNRLWLCRFSGGFRIDYRSSFTCSSDCKSRATGILYRISEL